mmetsp:Transcript_15090/g.33665  ORF Transcript_15090/g.33665 Transcript_15090/m.33665 type:complete len:107 (-) Transcript_15090:1904-2224(-)
MRNTLSSPLKTHPQLLSQSKPSARSSASVKPSTSNKKLEEILGRCDFTTVLSALKRIVGTKWSIKYEDINGEVVWRRKKFKKSFSATALLTAFQIVLEQKSGKREN